MKKVDSSSGECAREAAWQLSISLLAVQKFGDFFEYFKVTKHKLLLIIKKKFNTILWVRRQNWEKRLLASSYPSVRLSAKNLAPTGRICMKFDIWIFFFQNQLIKFKFHYNLTRITGILREDKYAFLIINRSFLLRMRNVPDKSCREHQNTLFVQRHF